MTRLIFAAVIALAPTFAAAWGKTSYYSYSSDRSASYTTESNNKGAQSTAETTASELSSETSQSGDDEAEDSITIDYGG